MSDKVETREGAFRATDTACHEFFRSKRGLANRANWRRRIKHQLAQQSIQNDSPKRAGDRR